jgi:hypothetical protein
MTTNTPIPAAEHHARRLAAFCGASVGTTPDGVLISWLSLDWTWKATGTQAMAVSDWSMLLTLMRFGAERKGAER